MKRNKRIIGILLSLFLIVGTTGFAYAMEATNLSKAVKNVSNKAIAYVRPEFAVQVKDKLQVFKDVKGQRVYPIVYNGNTYLPIRAISALMNEDIQWDNNSKTIYIGKTLMNPNKSKTKKNNENQGAAEGFDKENYIKPTWKSNQVMVEVRPDITIMYDFQIQKFTDISGNSICPIVYENSTYLPIRSISQLMTQEVQWDNTTKTILIGNQANIQEEPKEQSIYTKRLQAEFESAVELYDQATGKIVSLKTTTDAAMKTMLVESISADVQTAEKQTISIDSLKKSKMTDQEVAAQEALYDFAQISEHYLLVLENIAYLSVSGKDYSMLSDTFVSFALDSQSKMNTARKLIDAL
ncbi:stalk domain-containing protein [Aminipila terrae]|uniref:Copper amine oxidase-like N-terminal domain-containing protein n=1 Tax=Aminipila terrae TaxID=2697030 RepID=A0A6P1MDE9_9FIRM|nr:stalk domain-containing protein [Aminipila terrae]QHI72042.1 hypothetical protein Ami3637_06200 [Aminipila terrae]